MIGHINRSRRAHIVTIEDPIEVVHDDELSIIQQREVGIDTGSYQAALKHVVRQDPDVIFVGEIRDAESALSAIQAAETGHLVISTLHTIDCMETINRVLDLFPPQQAKEVRTSFAGALRGIVSQRLVHEGRRQGAACPPSRCSSTRGGSSTASSIPEQTDSDRGRDRRGRLLRDAVVRSGAGGPREGGARRRWTRLGAPRPVPDDSISARGRLGPPVGVQRRAVRRDAVLDPSAIRQLSGRPLGQRSPSGCRAVAVRDRQRAGTGMNSGPHARYWRTWCRSCAQQLILRPGAPRRRRSPMRHRDAVQRPEHQPGRALERSVEHAGVPPRPTAAGT